MIGFWLIFRMKFSVSVIIYFKFNISVQLPIREGLVIKVSFKSSEDNRVSKLNLYVSLKDWSRNHIRNHQRFGCLFS